MNEEIVVAIVADDRPRARIATALGRDGITPAAAAATIDELVAACADRRPHIVVVAARDDLSAALRRLTRELPRTRLVALVPAADRTLVREALLAGADGVVVAADVPVALPVTVRAVWSGQTAVPSASRATLEMAELSHREREVLDLMSAGLSNADIAERLCVTEHTVKSHVGSLFTKLGVHSRGEAIAAEAEVPARFGSPHERARTRAINGGTV